MLPQPPRLVFTTADHHRAVDAFRLDAVDYLLKPLDPVQVIEAANRLHAVLRRFATESLRVAPNPKTPPSTNGKPHAGATPIELLPVKEYEEGTGHSSEIDDLSPFRFSSSRVTAARRSWVFKHRCALDRAGESLVLHALEPGAGFESYVGRTGDRSELDTTRLGNVIAITPSR